MLEPTLNDGEAYVAGRSEETAKRLYDLAKKAGIDQSLVSTTSHGYIVPAELLDKEDVADEADDESAEDEAGEESAEYDPAEHSVAEVKEYLESADEAERQRVLDAEAASEKPRKGLLKEGDK